MSFPRYPKYKPSGVEWLGEVPEHWEVMPVRRIIDAPLSNGIFKKKEEFGEGTLLVNVFDIYQPDFKVVFDTLDRVRCDTSEIAAYQVLTGDLFFVRSSLKQEGIAVVAMADCPPEPVVYECHLIRARPNRRVFDGRFGSYILNSSVYRSTMIAKAKITTMTTIGQEAILSTQLPLPSLVEQSNIAAFLDLETAKIDELVAEQQRLMKLLKEKRQAVISHAVTQGLNAKAPMKPSGIEWLGDVPEHWSVKRLKHISPFITVGVVVNPSSFVADEGLPFIYGGDIREGVIDWTNSRRIDAKSCEANAKTKLKAGDLLTVRVGAPGVTAVVSTECEGGNCASVMLIRQGDFNSQWLCYAMNTRVVRFQVEVVQYGAAQEQFNIAHAVNFWTPTPPRAEQDKIVDFLDDETAKFDTLTAEAQRAIDLLQERRTALISAAVTGQIDVRPLSEKQPA